MIYTIENGYLKIKVSNIGATLISFLNKKTNTDIVLGFDTQQEYFKNSSSHLGATVGRNANRLDKGSFEIDGQKYQLSINEGDRCLHSGVGDLSFRAFSLKEITSDSISLSLFDGDMSGGFPGNLNLIVSYKLNKNKLEYSFSALCDKDSILNITNHSYFNLNGGINTIFDQELKINSDIVSLNIGPMASEETIKVDNTAFDFKEYRNIKSVLDKNHPNLSKKGLDHNYIFENLEYKEMARLRNDKLELIISSDLPDIHIYTANYLGDVVGKNNINYHDYYGICFEAQYYPNSLNYKKYLKPYIYANKEIEHKITYMLNER